MPHSHALRLRTFIFLVRRGRRGEVVEMGNCVRVSAGAGIAAGEVVEVVVMGMGVLGSVGCVAASVAVGEVVVMGMGV
jgi:hypothetical protein